MSNKLEELQKRLLFIGDPEEDDPEESEDEDDLDDLAPSAPSNPKPTSVPDRG